MIMFGSSSQKIFGDALDFVYLSFYLLLVLFNLHPLFQCLISFLLTILLSIISIFHNFGRINFVILLLITNLIFRLYFLRTWERKLKNTGNIPDFVLVTASFFTSCVINSSFDPTLFGSSTIIFFYFFLLTILSNIKSFIKLEKRTL